MAGESGTLEMSETLAKVVAYCLGEARMKIEDGSGVVPFSVIVKGDDMYIEEFPGEDVVASRRKAEDAIRAASDVATDYGLCYDGFLNSNQGQIDAVLVEAGNRDMDHSLVIGLIYEVGEDGKAKFVNQPAFIQNGAQFFDMEQVKKAKEREAASQE